jgi:hypothetical protein
MTCFVMFSVELLVDGGRCALDNSGGKSFKLAQSELRINELQRRMWQTITRSCRCDANVSGARLACWWSVALSGCVYIDVRPS